MNKLAGLLIAFALVAFTAADTYAQRVVVRTRPARPTVVVTRPVAPSPRAVWVEEEWVPQGRGYAWHGGYWAAPPRPGVAWVAGHWRHGRGGWVWIPGHWR